MSGFWYGTLGTVFTKNTGVFLKYYDLIYPMSLKVTHVNVFCYYLPQQESPYPRHSQYEVATHSGSSCLHDAWNEGKL